MNKINILLLLRRRTFIAKMIQIFSRKMIQIFDSQDIYLTSSFRTLLLEKRCKNNHREHNGHKPEK